MCHIAPVNILSRDRSWIVVIQGDGALACACAGARNIEHAKAALLIEHKPVIHVASVDVPGTGTGAGQGTIPLGNNNPGAITGEYIDGGNVVHGFLVQGL